MEVKNDSTAPYWFLPSGLDPNYFSPSEAAFAFHTNSDDANRKLDEKFQKLQFQNPVRPGSTEAGFVLVENDGRLVKRHSLYDRRSARGIGLQGSSGLLGKYRFF